jgi:ABC-2 type transport system permease protein
MYGFYLGELPSEAASFLVSGVPALALFPVGFVIVPNVISSHRIADTYDYVWSLPVPRLASAGATFSVFTAISLPGTVLALFISTLVYDVQLDPSWRIVPAVLLVASMATAVGYALGQGIANPRLVNLITNLLVFAVLMFSPIVIPIELFPDWFGSVHRVLPFWHMANLIRDGLTAGFVADVASSYYVSIVWMVLAVAVAARVIARRD